MGFHEDIQRIIKYLPPNSQRQTFLFSATVSPKVQDVARAAMSPGHKFINCVEDSDTDTHAHIPQYHTVLPSGADVLPHVLRLIAHDQLIAAKEGQKSKIVLFLNTTKMVQLFAELLKDTTGTLPLKGAKKTVVYEMHSQRTMANRTRVSAAFRNDVSTRSGAVLVTSDVSARGVDYPGVTRVIQLGVPSSGDVYTHRVGRTGRAGRAGRGDLVLMAWEMGFLRRELGDVGLKPLKMDDLKEEIVALIDESKDASSSSSSVSPPTTYTRAALSEIDTVSAEIARNLAASDMDATAGALMSTLGFYLGRLQQIGCRADDMVNGMQSFFKEMCGLSEPLHLSRKMLELLGGGYRPGMQSRSSGGGFRSTRGGGYGSGGYGSGGSRSGPDRNVRGGSYGSSSTRREGGYGSSSTHREGGYGSSSTRREGGYGSSSPSSSFGRSSYSKPSYSSYDKPSYSSHDKPSYSSSIPSSYGSREGRSSSYTPRSSSSDSYSPGGYGSRGLRGGFGNSPMKKRSWDDE
jgi:ATP-dependent RNA helicase MSS116